MSTFEPFVPRKHDENCRCGCRELLLARRLDVEIISNALAQAHVMHLDTAEAVAALARLAGRGE